MGCDIQTILTENWKINRKLENYEYIKDIDKEHNWEYRLSMPYQKMFGTKSVSDFGIFA